MITPPSETTADVRFPEMGVDLSGAFGQQRPGTTRSGVNVRAFEPDSGRARGGQRPGLARYPDDALPGVVQEIASVVLPSGQAVGISFDDVPTLNTAFQLEDPTGFVLADGTTNWVRIGGSGNYTHKSYVRSLRRPVINSITPDDGDFEGGDDVTIEGEDMGDEDAVFTFGGLEGTTVSNDGTTAVVTTPAAATDIADPEVNVQVRVGAFTSPITENTVYTYQIRFVQAKAGGVGEGVGVTTLGVTFDTDITAGDLILAFPAFSGGPGGAISVGVTDNAGNTYTQIGTNAFDGSFLQTDLSCWYAIASTSGPCTVTMTVNADQTYMGMVILQYDGIRGTELVDASVSDRATSAAPSTGSVTVTAVGSLLLGAFARCTTVMAFTPTSPATLRAENTDGSANMAVHVADKISPSTPNDSVSGTWPNNTAHAFMGVSLKHR